MTGRYVSKLWSFGNIFLGQVKSGRPKAKGKGPWALSGALIGGLWSVKLRLEPLSITRRAESLGAIRVQVQILTVGLIRTI